MDTASTLIGIGLLLVFISPIAFMLLKNREKVKNTSGNCLPYHRNTI